MDRVSNPFRQSLHSTLRMVGLLFIFGLFMASGCSQPADDQHTPVTISIGTDSASYKPATNDSPSILASKISDSYSYLSKVTLKIVAEGYTTASINEKLNESKFTLASGEDALLIDEETFTVNVPAALDVTFIVTAYNTDGYQIYSATSTLLASQLTGSGFALAMSLQVDVDPAVPVTTDDLGCSGDADSDGFCDEYENLFVVFDGSSWIADVDGDETPNYLDTDSDNDGLSDGVEGNAPSNDGYPRFIHANLAPTAVSLQITTNEDTSSSGNIPNVTDPDVGDTFTITKDTDPTNGTAAIISNTVTYTPNAGFAGSDSFLITATDQGGLTVQGTVTVTVINTSNTAPTATGASLTIDEDSPQAITLVGNDVDATDTLTYAIVSAPSNGSLIGTLPNIVYTPNADYFGSDSFDFKVSDGTADSNIATVSITINSVNDAPTGVPDGPVSFDISSVDSAELPADWHSYIPVTNDNGRFVAFWSGASNLVADDTNTSYDVFLRDASTGTTERVTVNDAGVEANTLGTEIANLYPPSISIDGRYIVFDTIADNLSALDTGTFSDIYLRDRLEGTTTAVTACSSIGTGNSFNPSISPDGQHIVFTSEAADPWPGCDAVNDLNGVSDIYLKTVLSPFYLRASEPALGGDADGPSFEPSISDDGQWVAFTSGATNLIASDTNGRDDVYLKDVINGAVVRVSVDSLGAETIGGKSTSPSINADGTVIAFASKATNLTVGYTDPNDDYDVFVRDIVAGTTTRVSVDSAGNPGNGVSGQPKISKDGRFVVFASLATNLVPKDTNNKADIFIHDLATATTSRLSVDGSLNQANGHSGVPALSGNGQYVVFASEASNLASGDSNGWIDILRLSRTDLTTVELGSVSTAVVTANDFDVENDPISITGNSGAQEGTVTDTGGGIYSYTSTTSGFVGIDTFTYSISDGSATGTGTVSIAINRDNYDPQGVSDTATTTYMTDVVIDVLANDFDLDGDTLSIGYLDESSAAGGFMSVNTDNTITFTPASATPPTDSFNYSVTDGSRTSGLVRVTVTINP